MMKFEMCHVQKEIGRNRSKIMHDFRKIVGLPSTETHVINSNNYHSLIRDSGSKGNNWTKERLCGGEYAWLLSQLNIIR